MDASVGVRASLARFVVELSPTRVNQRPPQTVPGSRGVEVGDARLGRCVMSMRDHVMGRWWATLEEEVLGDRGLEAARDAWSM